MDSIESEDKDGEVYITELWICEDCGEEFEKDGGYKNEQNGPQGDWQNGDWEAANGLLGADLDSSFNHLGEYGP
jgi:hypothetical protein